MFLDSQLLLDIKICAWAGLRSAGASPKPELRAALAKSAVKRLGIPPYATLYASSGDNAR